MAINSPLLVYVKKNLETTNKIKKKSKLWHIHLYMSFFLCNFAG